MAFLRSAGEYASAPRPDLILLDLNLPRKDGREVLAGDQADESLRHIPVVILTTSKAEQDILRSYQLERTPTSPSRWTSISSSAVVKSIEQFWLEVVKLARP